FRLWRQRPRTLPSLFRRKPESRTKSQLARMSRYGLRLSPEKRTGSSADSIKARTALASARDRPAQPFGEIEPVAVALYPGAHVFVELLAGPREVAERGQRVAVM